MNQNYAIRQAKNGGWEVCTISKTPIKLGRYELAYVRLKLCKAYSDAEKYLKHYQKLVESKEHGKSTKK